MHFPIERKWGVGLQLPFDTMVRLAAVETAHYVDGGIVFTGLFSAPVPVRRDEATNSIQWHFEGVAPDEATDFLRLRDLKSCAAGESWFKTTDIGVLRNATCFLG